MFGELPSNWQVVAPEVMEHARAQAHAALADETIAVGNLAAYYRVEGNYAGSTFVDLHPNDPVSLSGSDLMAVTMLSVEIPQVAVRRIVGPGRTSEYLAQLLSDPAMSPSLNLTVAGAKTLEKMSEFYDAVKKALAPVGARDSDRWVTASKVCARKRPDLFPVRDTVVTNYLGLRSLRSYAMDWQVFCGLLEDEALMRQLRHVVDRASIEDGVEMGNDGPLRHLDVVLWKHAGTQRTA